MIVNMLYVISGVVNIVRLGLICCLIVCCIIMVRKMMISNVIVQSMLCIVKWICVLCRLRQSVICELVVLMLVLMMKFGMFIYMCFSVQVVLVMMMCMKLVDVNCCVWFSVSSVCEVDEFNKRIYVVSVVSGVIYVVVVYFLVQNQLKKDGVSKLMFSVVKMFSGSMIVWV